MSEPDKEFLDLPLTDVTCAVQMFGGVKKTARLFGFAHYGDLITYMRHGYLPLELAKKLSKETGFSVRSLTNAV